MAALLKDSFREALDRKIFAAMLLLSGVLTLFVASISFRRISLQDELNHAAGQVSWLMGLHTRGEKPKFSVENFRQTNDAAEPWNGDYRFEWVVKVDEADKLKNLPMANHRDLRHMMRDEFKYLKNVDVGENSSTDPREVRFAVTSQGTKVDDALAWRHEPTVLFAVPLPIFTTSLRNGVFFLENSLVGGLGAWVAVLVGVIVTASFIPNMLQKGAVDLILSKPVRRPSLLIYKYLGGLVFVLILTAVTVLGVWAAIGLRTGVWSPGFLMVIPAVTFYFALLYAVSTLVAVWTRSSVVAILLTCAFSFALWVNGTVHDALAGIRKAQTEAEDKIRMVTGAEKDEQKPGDADRPGRPFDVPNWVSATSDFFHNVLPRTGDLNQLTDRWVAHGLLSEAEIKSKKLEMKDAPNIAEVVGVTGAFIVAIMGLACWKFAKTDY